MPVPSAPSAPDLLAVSDSGSSSSDNITKVALPIFGGTGEAGATVTLLDGADTIGAGIVAADGTWSITATKALTEGTNAITARQTDTAGNTSAVSAALNVVLDTIAPVAPSTPDLLAGSDSGASNSDNITNVALPSFVGTGEPGAIVTLLDGATTVGTGQVASNGTWSITVTKALTEGANAITATQTDVAGNTSAASAALDVVLDTIAPVAPSTPDLLAGSDSGASNSDNITNVALPVFFGTGVPGDTVKLLDGATTIGTGTVTGDGSWSITATKALTEGANAITATQTDVAGNTSAASAALDVVLDTKALPPAALRLAPASDSGASNSDKITNIATPTIDGTGEAGATITLLDGSTSIGTAVVAGDGTWSIELTRALHEGTNTFTATQTDVAGNTSPASATLNVVLDTTAPIVSGNLVSNTSGSGIDHIAMNPSLSGSGDPNTVVTFTDGMTVPLGQTTSNASGAWTFELPELSSGPHTITASQTDAAGNTGSQTISLTTIASSAPTTDGVSTAEVSSSDLSQQLQSGASLQFVGGTKTILLADGTLSVAPDTNEAFLTRLYEGLLGRAPDKSGLSSWDTQLHGSSKAVVAQSFLDSNEYQGSHAGQTDSQFVDSLYQSMLGRPGEAGGVEYWAQALAGGMSRGEVASAFADSPEAIQHWSDLTAGGIFAYDPNAAIVRADYQMAFGRDADTGGLTFWTNLLNSGATTAQLAQDFTMSSEFQTLHGEQTDTQYVQSLYQTDLGRQPEPQGLQYWVGELQSGTMTRADVLTAFAGSPEGLQHLHWAL